MKNEDALTPIDDELNNQGLELIGDLKSNLSPLEILEKQEHGVILESVIKSVGKFAIYHEQMLYALVKIEQINLPLKHGVPPLVISLVWNSDSPHRRCLTPLAELNMQAINESQESETKDWLDSIRHLIDSPQTEKVFLAFPNRYTSHFLSEDHDSSGMVGGPMWDIELDQGRVALFKSCVETLPANCGWRITTEKLIECNVFSDAYGWVEEGRHMSVRMPT